MCVGLPTQNPNRTYDRCTITCTGLCSIKGLRARMILCSWSLRLWTMRGVDWLKALSTITVILFLFWGPFWEGTLRSVRISRKGGCSSSKITLSTRGSKLKKSYSLNIYNDNMSNYYTMILIVYTSPSKLLF